MHTNKNTVLLKQHICSFTVFPIQRDNSVYESRALTKANILTSEMQAQTNCTTGTAELSNDDAQTAQPRKEEGHNTQIHLYLGTGNNYQAFPCLFLLYIFWTLHPSTLMFITLLVLSVIKQTNQSATVRICYFNQSSCEQQTENPDYTAEQ